MNRFFLLLEGVIINISLVFSQEMQVHIVNDATIRVPVSVVDSITFDDNNSSTIIIDNIEDGGVTVNGQVYLFDFDGSKYATKDELELKQNKLKAGNNITIAEDGTISVSSEVTATDDDARQGVDKLRNFKADCIDGSIDNLLLEPYDFSNITAWHVNVGNVSSDKDKVIAHKTYKQIYITTDNTVINSATSQYNYVFCLKFKGSFDITNSVSVELYNGDKRIAYKSTSISSIQTIGEWSQSIININGTKNATSYKITINLKSSEDIGEVTMPILCELTNENMADLESSGYYDTFKISDKVNRAKTADVALAVSDSLCNDIIDKAKEDVVKADTKSSYSDVRVC